MRAIGHYHTDKIRKLDAPRQAQLDASIETGKNKDYILIDKTLNGALVQGLQDLEGFSHIWLVFKFHQSKTWKPMVQPPRGIDRKVGVFASRSPYRPNAIGLSLVRLLSVQGNKVLVEGGDLIDGTPILDIKPYVPAFDSVGDASLGWMEYLNTPELKISYSALAKEQILFLDPDDPSVDIFPRVPLAKIIQQQLSRSPFASHSKRVKRITETEGIFSYRLWRVLFEVHAGQVHVLEVSNAYLPETRIPNSVSPDEIQLYLNFNSKFAGAVESSTLRPLA